MIFALDIGNTNIVLGIIDTKTEVLFCQFLTRNLF